MSTLTVAPSRNGTKPQAPARVVPLLGPTIDELYRLRGLMRQAQEEERRLTGEILRACNAAGVTRLEGTSAVAIVDSRTTLKPDVALFLEAVGRRGYKALSVSVTAARQLMGADDLAAISETVTSPVLRVESIAEPATE